MKSTKLNSRIDEVIVGCNRLKLKINKYREHNICNVRNEIIDACDELSMECLKVLSDLMSDRDEKEKHREAAIKEAMIVYNICYNLKIEIGDYKNEIQDI